MTDTATCDRLNALLIDLGRSLLQYAGEAWPWTAFNAAAELKTLVSRLCSLQCVSVRSLAELLDQEGHAIDFGVYPDEYTSLHYVSLEYFLERLMADERDLVGECRAAASSLPAGSPAADLLGEITRREEAILSELGSHRRS